MKNRNISSFRIILCLAGSLCFIGSTGGVADAAPSGTAYRFHSSSNGANSAADAKSSASRSLNKEANAGAFDHASAGNSDASLERISQSEVADPLAFLEGDAKCGEVIRGISTRYGGRDGNDIQLRKLSAVLLEEYRHVSKETCRARRFASCRFEWCNGSDAAPVVASLDSANLGRASLKHEIIGEASGNSDEQKERPASSSAVSSTVSSSVRNDRSVVRNETSGAVGKVTSRSAAFVPDASVDDASVRDASAHDAVKGQPQDDEVVEKEMRLRRAALADPGMRDDLDMKSDSSSPKDSALESGRSSAHSGDDSAHKGAQIAGRQVDRGQVDRGGANPALIQMDIAQANLARIVKERNERLAQLVASRKAAEEKMGTTWKMFSVPGGDRAPRVRLTAQVGNNIGATNGNAAQIGSIADHVAPAKSGAISVPASMVPLPDPENIGPGAASSEPTAAAFRDHVRVNDPSLNRAEDMAFKAFSDAAKSRRPLQ